MTLLDPATATTVVVNRWHRFGHDRAYVRVDGRDVGFRDLSTGVAECSVVAALDTLMDATDELVHLDLARAAAPSHAAGRATAVTAPHAYRGRHARETAPAPCSHIWLVPSA